MPSLAGRWLPSFISHPIYSRDFGYPNSPRRRVGMAPEIGDSSAKEFAEYVQPPESLVTSPAVSFCTNSDHWQHIAKSMRERLLSGPTVDVYVGTDKRHWRLHCNLLAYHAEYLQAELRQAWSSDDTTTKSSTSESLRLDLPEDDPKGFELLVKYLYQGRLDDVSNISEPELKYDYAVACHKLYLLCRRFGMTNLTNLAIDQYRRGLSQAELVPDGDELCDIYNRSPNGSPFRDLMARIAARQIMDPVSDKDAEHYRSCFEAHPDFAIGLFNAIKEGTGGLLLADPTEGDDCAFHDHRKGAHCGKHSRGDSSQSISEASWSSSPATPTRGSNGTLPHGVKGIFTTVSSMRLPPELAIQEEELSTPTETKFGISRDEVHELPSNGKSSTPGSTPSRRPPPKLAIRSRASPVN